MQTHTHACMRGLMNVHVHFSPAALNLDSAAVVKDLSLSKLSFAEYNCFSRPSLDVSAEAMESLRLHCNIECMHAGVCVRNSNPQKRLICPGFVLEPRRSSANIRARPPSAETNTGQHCYLQQLDLSF